MREPRSDSMVAEKSDQDDKPTAKGKAKKAKPPRWIPFDGDTEKLPVPKFDKRTGKPLTRPERRYYVRGTKLIAIYRAHGGIHRKCMTSFNLKTPKGKNLMALLKKYKIPGI